MDFRSFKNLFIKDNYGFIYNMPENLFDLFLYILNMKYIKLDNEIYVTYKDEEDKMINYIITIFSYNEETLLLDKEEFVNNFIDYFQFHPSLIYKIRIPLDNIVAKYFISIYCAYKYYIDIFQSSNQYEEYLILEKLNRDYDVLQQKNKNKKNLKLDQYIYDNYIPFDYNFRLIYNNNKDLFFINKEYKSYIYKDLYKNFIDVYNNRNYKKFYVHNIQGSGKVYYKLFFEKPEIFQKYIQGKIELKEISISLITDIAKNKNVYINNKEDLKKLLVCNNNIGSFYNIWKKLKNLNNFFLIDIDNYKKISLSEFEKNFNYYYLIQNIRFIFYVLQI